MYDPSASTLMKIGKVVKLKSSAFALKAFTQPEGIRKLSIALAFTLKIKTLEQFITPHLLAMRHYSTKCFSLTTYTLFKYTPKECRSV